MTYVWRGCLATLAFGVASVIVACRDQPPPPQPAPTPPPPTPCPQVGNVRSVPLNVIRVLHRPSGGGAGDQPDAQDNKGCRLTSTQIRGYVDQAAEFYLRSVHVSLVQERDPQQQLVIHEYFVDMTQGLLPSESPRRDRHNYHWYCCEMQDAGNQFDPNKLNIFFTGNIKEMDSNGWLHSTNALTLDPANNVTVPCPGGPPVLIRPHVMLNDRGGNENPGRFVSADGVLEHELGHWFPRQQRGEGGRYDEAEHIPCPTPPTPCTVPYIMKQYTPHPLKFQDVPPVCESFEIWYKAATWNQP